MLIDLLSVWAGKNHDIQYKQGMNEIAGLVLFAVAEESLHNPYPLASISDLVKSYFYPYSHSPEKLVCFLNDQSLVQADAYAIFSRIMKLGVKQLYIEKEVKITKGRPEAEDYSVFFSTEFNVSKQPSFYVRCYRIIFMLREADSALYDNLLPKSIEPPVLLLRWLKCFLCREFSTDNVFIIWDSILANINRESLAMLTDTEYNPLSQSNFLKTESDPLHFLDFLSVAMLEVLRETLMKSADNSECLLKVLDFPDLNNVENLIKSAIALKDHHNNQKQEKDSPKSKKKWKAEMPSVKNTDWVSNSTIFFSSFPRMKVLVTNPKTIKEIPVATKPVKLSAIEKLDACIRILEKEQDKRESKKVSNSIAKLRETLRTLK
eukprot:TRINITY_DN7809_c0_g2_i6.p1 TRINITY_DN7809_c0_g2~~TRINITY_DN7809_c0_g2_i6.p1  ORF type:complete len:377 (+),score=109.15 TRINITY_DN7809_c0_g2_i6:581-1711(+)